MIETLLRSGCRGLKTATVLLLATIPTLSSGQPGSASELSTQALNPPTPPNSMAPRLAALDGQGAVLTWLERREAGHRLRFTRFDGEGFGQVGTIAEGRFFANWADTPGLTTSSDGETWLAHWLQRSGRGTYAYDVMASISADQGLTWTPPFSPHDDGTPTEHGFVSYFPGDQERIGMVWLDGRETRPAPEDRSEGHAHHHGDGAMTLRTAQIDAAGVIHEEALLDARVCDCCGTAAAMTSDGPVVVYRDRSSEELRDISIVRHTTDGWTEPMTVHDDGWRITGCPVNGPAILARGEDVVVAWFTLGKDDTPRVRVARSIDGGRQFSEPRDLDTGVALGRVDLAWQEEGFILSWLSEKDGGMLRLARFDSAGNPVSTHDLLPLYGGRTSGFPRLLALEDGSTLVAWTDVDTVSGDPRVRLTRVQFGGPGMLAAP